MWLNKYALVITIDEERVMFTIKPNSLVPNCLTISVIVSWKLMSTPSLNSQSNIFVLASC